MTGPTPNAIIRTLAPAFHPALPDRFCQQNRQRGSARVYPRFRGNRMPFPAYVKFSCAGSRACIDSPDGKAQGRDRERQVQFREQLLDGGRNHRNSEMEDACAVHIQILRRTGAPRRRL